MHTFVPESETKHTIQFVFTDSLSMRWVLKSSSLFIKNGLSNDTNTSSNTVEYITWLTERYLAAASLCGWPRGAKQIRYPSKLCLIEYLDKSEMKHMVNKRRINQRERFLVRYLEL